MKAARPRTALREQAREIQKEERQLLLSPDLAAAELSRRRLSFFVKEMWSIIVEDELVWNWHLDVLCDEIQQAYERVIGIMVPDPNNPKRKIRKRLPKDKDVIINIPPGTSKSTIATIMAPAWSWTRDPSLRHITASYSMSLSTEHAMASRNIIRSDKYRTYFPEVEIRSDQDNKTNYRTTKNGQRYVTSIGGTVTGVHAHIITIDDPLNPKQAASIDQVNNANAWFDSTIPMRKVDKAVTVTILIMQRLATNDPTGHLLEKKKNSIHHVRLPATDSINVSPLQYRQYYTKGYLDLVRLGPKAVSEARLDLGSAGFAGQMDQMPAPAGGLIWKKWFKEIPDHLFPAKHLMSKYGKDWDLAYTDKDENAASAFIAAGKIGHNIYIDDVQWEWYEFPKLIGWMKKIGGPHYIEAKASGKSAKQSLTKMGIVAIEVEVAGGDKVARANMATPPAEAGMVFIRKSIADKLYNDSKQGILLFPKSPWKDVADVLAQAIQRLHGNGKIVVSNDDTSTLDNEDLEWIESDL
ncbi:hypothetical protein F0919_17950 [Taibaiella lutea]|uniref:Terminase large subunit gp17-like C-terminal domain-containing protein n=1 Tax=Taibaiella lutea TaxID=2608001 RepID=A0A5M6CGX2_9BACT|nr:hypothetical protein [Taibaiella lutea]KAA5532665.1 hypothetical protein F0919_17950 [Taibaiella lutea]